MAYLLHTPPSGLNHLAHADSEGFSKYMTRWSEIGKRMPAAILLPKSEQECQEAVRWTIANDVPFVCKSGGMSLYSTTDENGVVIDLSEFSSVRVSTSRRTATLGGSIISKTVAVELAKHGFCTTLPSTNTVGAIPFFINGGNSRLTSNLGFGSDCVISARMITADGDLIDINETSNSELLYAIRGAGQYFGLVTSLTIKISPLEEALDNPDGTIWTGPFIFPPSRAQEVCQALSTITSNTTYSAGGLILIGAPPPTRKPAVAVIARLIGKNAAERQKEAFKPLYDLQPLFTAGAEIAIANLADSQDPLCAPGGYKKLALIGLRSLEPDVFAEVVELWEEMVGNYLDATNSWFSIIWDTNMPKRPELESANSMHDVKFWANNLIWTGKGENVQALEGYMEKAVGVLRRNQDAKEYVDFSNSLRAGPIERRYRGEKRLEMLRRLKARWDPNGRFGREFL